VLLAAIGNLDHALTKPRGDRRLGEKKTEGCLVNSDLATRLH